MTLSDYILTSLNNIRKNKLRSVLTIIGVAVAIGALTSMLSLGIGLQKNLNKTINENKLLTQITVTIPDNRSTKIQFNDSTINEIRKIDGVETAFKENRIPSKIIFQKINRNTTIKSIPYSYKKYFKADSYKAGTFFQSDTSLTLIITDKFIQELIAESDSTLKNNAAKIDSIVPSLIGKEIIVSAITIDTKVFSNMFTAMTYLMSNKLPFRDSLLTFTIGAVIKQNSMSDWGTGVYITESVAKNIPQLNFENVWDLLDKKDLQNFQPLIVYTNGLNETESVSQKITQMGFNTRSILNDLKEVKQMFLIMDSILGALGIMALFIATLGLVNTLIMSIYERTKEIGILKSLGAKDKQVRALFISEAGFIGFIGAVVGVPLGWGVTKLINAILFSTLFADAVNEKIVLFSFPWYLIIGAVVFSVLFSILAGLYPATRASKVNPVKALRHE